MNNKDIIKTELNVVNNKIRIMRINNIDYISLTDLARYANPIEPKIPVQTWMRNKSARRQMNILKKAKELKN